MLFQSMGPMLEQTDADLRHTLHVSSYFGLLAWFVIFTVAVVLSLRAIVMMRGAGQRVFHDAVRTYFFGMLAVAIPPAALFFMGQAFFIAATGTSE
jgi:hypothetical protein